MTTMFRQIALGVIALLVPAGASPAYAQTRESEGNDLGEDVEKSKAMEEKEEKEKKNERPPKRPGIEQFEDVNVERTRPDALPPASATEVPDVLKGRANKLPRPPSAERLEKTTAHVKARTFELVATKTPRAPGETSTLVHRGHAVLVSSPDNEETPILVTTYFWLEDVEQLYLVPKDTSLAIRSSGSGHDVERRSLQEVTVNGRDDGWLAEHEDELVEAKLYEPDKNRNLVTVVPQPVDALDLPDRGLELFDLEDTSPTRLYGYSPQDPNGFRQTKLLASHPDQKSLMYYLQTNYPAVFGAPIVSTDGRLLVLTAFRHPKDREKVLVIPPKPIASYLEDVLSNLE